MTTDAAARHRPRLLFATTNPGKLREARELLAPVPLELVSLADLGLRGTVAEDGADYAANARRKAAHWARASGLAALGEDSGIEVDFLGGAPGVHSARYGGEEADDRERNRMVLRALDGVPAERRGARFVSVLILAAPDGRELARAEGECRGRIALEPRGEGGFGYDPIFEPSGLGATFAEVGSEVKARLSHRGRAFRQLAHRLDRHRHELGRFLAGG